MTTDPDTLTGRELDAALSQFMAHKIYADWDGLPLVLAKLEEMGFYYRISTAPGCDPGTEVFVGLKRGKYSLEYTGLGDIMPVAVARAALKTMEVGKCESG